MRFKNKVVVITGGGSGIGAVMSLMFAAEGAAVVVADWNEEGAQAIVVAITGTGGRATALVADVSQPSDAEKIAASAMEHYGRLDILINNAAVAGGDDVLSIDPKTWEHEIKVVLTGTYLCVRAALPIMIEQQSGVIVNIASVNGISAMGNEAYSAAKAGVINFTQGIAMRHGRHGIRANAIAPGTIRTPIWQARLDRDPQIFERLVKWYPLGRVGEPEDVAKAAMFLASDDAGWISGTVLPVDGGLLAGNGVMTKELVAMLGHDD